MTGSGGVTRSGGGTKSGYAAEGLLAQESGWSSKTFVVLDVPLTQDGGACRIPQRVLCGGRVPPGPAATFHGILRESAAGRLAWFLRVPTGSLMAIAPSTGVIVGNVSGGGGCPGGVIRFAKAWENKSSRFGFCAIGSLVPLVPFVLV